MSEHNELGNEGELRAQAFLRDKGYRIRHTNWRTGQLELDIVAEKDDILVVVEVKTRTSQNLYSPAIAIDNRKIRNIVNATDEYIRRYGWQGETRFDIISVSPQGQNYIIDHIEDAFLPPIY